MPVTTALAIFFLIWWVVLFAVLPWGIRSQHEGQEMVAGTDPGAPTKARINAWSESTPYAYRTASFERPMT